VLPVYQRRLRPRRRRPITKRNPKRRVKRTTLTQSRTRLLNASYFKKNGENCLFVNLICNPHCDLWGGILLLRQAMFYKGGLYGSLCVHVISVMVYSLPFFNGMYFFCLPDRYFYDRCKHARCCLL
jgi:hypothetical protein